MENEISCSLTNRQSLWKVEGGRLKLWLLGGKFSLIEVNFSKKVVNCNCFLPFNSFGICGQHDIHGENPQTD